MKEYKPIIIILIKFFSIYLIITGLYYLYLDYYQNKLFTCDPYTEIVALHASSFLHFFGIRSEVFYINQENFMRFFINGRLASIVNEGCNALSVIILYWSFIIAFSSSIKKTVVYLLVTTIILYIANIIRIAFINYVFHFYPQYGKETHDYIFPALIYGLVILLWFVWIKYFLFKRK